MKDSRSVIQRLSLVLGVRNDTQLAEKLGVPRNNVATWKNRGTIPYSHCVDVSESNKVSLDWLLLGTGQATHDERGSGSQSAYQAAKASGMLMSKESATGALEKGKQQEQIYKIADDLTSRLECLEEELEIVSEADDFPAVVAPPAFKQNLIDSVAKLKELGSQNIIHAQNGNARRFDEDFAMIPVLDVEASAGHGSLVDQEDVRYSLAFRKDWIQQEFGITAAKLRIITARGDSMDSGNGREKDIHDGDMLLINSEVTKIEADAIYIIQVDGHVIVKRIQQMIDGSVQIISANADYKVQTIAADAVSDIRITGRVVWVIAGRKA